MRGGWSLDLCGSGVAGVVARGLPADGSEQRRQRLNRLKLQSRLLTQRH